VNGYPRDYSPKTYFFSFLSPIVDRESNMPGYSTLERIRLVVDEALGNVPHQIRRALPYSESAICSRRFPC